MSRETGKIHVALLNEVMARNAGSPRKVLALARGLDTRRYEVSLILHKRISPDLELDMNGVNVLSPRFREDIPTWLAELHFAREVLQEVRRQRINILHFHWLAGAHPALLAAKTAGVTVVRTVRAALQSQGTGILARLWDKCTDAWTVLSPDLIPSLKAQTGAPDRKITVTPNGYDLARTATPTVPREKMRERLRVGSQEFVWLAVGRLAPQKDYPTMLEAFSLAMKQSSCLRLLIAGDGPLQESLEKMIRSMGLDERVALLGFCTDVPSLLGAADAFVIATLYEGMSGATAEAMIAGVPVVGTDAPGVSYPLDYGKAGILVPCKEPAKMAEAIVRVTRNAAFRRELAEKGRRRAWTQWPEASMVRRYEELYERLIQRRREPRCGETGAH